MKKAFQMTLLTWHTFTKKISRDLTVPASGGHSGHFGG